MVCSACDASSVGVLGLNVSRQFPLGSKEVTGGEGGQNWAVAFQHNHPGHFTNGLFRWLEGIGAA